MADATRTIRTKFDGDASDLVRATRAAQRAVDQFGKNSGKTFIQRFRQFITGENDPSTLGTNFGKLFGSGIVRGLAVPGFGPALFTVLLAAAAVAGPAIGAALATGAVAAAGAGLAGLGIVFAAQAEQVKTAFTSLFSGLATDMRAISRPLQGVLVEIAGFMQRTFDSFKPILAGAFSGLAPIIQSFAHQFFAALEQFRPAITAISDAFGDLLTRLGPKLGPLFTDLADTITNIAETVSRNSEAFASLATFILDAADAAVEFVGKLAEMYGWLSKVDGIVDDARDAFDETEIRVARFGNTFGDIAPQMSSAFDEADRLGWKIDSTGSKFADAAADVRSMTEALAAHQEQLLAATNPVFALTSALTNYEAAQTATNDAIKEFGVDSPEATTAALELAQATAGLEAAAIDGDLSFGAFESALSSWVAEGRITAEQAGIIRGRVAEARGEAEDFQGTYKATVEANTAAAMGRLQAIKAILDSIRSKTITITTRASIPAPLTARSIEYYERRQHGGPVRPGRHYLVGEAGPELLKMGTSGGQIVPNNQVKESAGWDERAITRAIAAGINGATLVIDDHGRGRLVSRTADLYARAG